MVTTPQQSSGSQSDRESDPLKQTLENEKTAATRAMHDAEEATRSKATELADEAKQGALRKAEDVQRQASSSLHGFAEAVRTAGDQLAAGDQGMAARVVREAASGLEQLSSTLARKSPVEIIDDVREMGRRHPTAFIAGTVLAGLALGRIVASSASRTHAGNETRGTGSSAPSQANGAGARRHTSAGPGLRPGTSEQSAGFGSSTNPETTGRSK